MSWNPQTINMVAPTVYIGLAVTSHNVNAPTTASFSGVTTTGSVSGAWQVAEIGTDHPANSPQKVYVTVEDSAGKTATVVHPDPAATLATTWTEWSIPLSSFAGVNLGRDTEDHHRHGRQGQSAAERHEHAVHRRYPRRPIVRQQHHAPGPLSDRQGPWLFAYEARRRRDIATHPAALLPDHARTLRFCQATCGTEHSSSDSHSSLRGPARKPQRDRDLRPPACCPVRWDLAHVEHRSCPLLPLGQPSPRRSADLPPAVSA